MRKFSRLFALLALMAVISHGTAQEEPAKTANPAVLVERVGLVFPFFNYGNGVVLYMSEYTPDGEDECEVFEPVWYEEAEESVMPCPWEVCPNDFRPPLRFEDNLSRGLRAKLHPVFDLAGQVPTSLPQRPGTPHVRWNPRRALTLRDPAPNRRYPTIQLGENGPSVVVRVWEATLNRRRAGLPANESGGSPVWRRPTPFYIAAEVDVEVRASGPASTIVATKNPYGKSDHQYRFPFDFDGTGRSINVELITYTAGK